MKYWFIINNQQSGPFELDDLRQIDFNGQTPVWHAGLTEWIPASQVPEVNAILIERDRSRRDNGCHVYPEVKIMEPEVVENVYVENGDPQRGNMQGGRARRRDESERPSNYLAWAIIATILCCVPLGVVAIIYSASVNTKFDRGDVEGARKASERAQWWIILSIVLGLISSPFQALLSML